MAKLISGINDLATMFPEIAFEWHPTFNGELTPKNFSQGTEHQAHWLGKRCRHEWVARIKDRVKGSGCPVCSGKKVLIGFNDLTTIVPDIASEWHSTLNGELTPQDFTQGTNAYAYWMGKHCEHSWKSRISRRVRGDGCPVCSGQQVLCGFNDLDTIAFDVASEWHPILNGELTPKEFTGGSDHKAHWLCKVCTHTWSSQIKNRVKKSSGCPNCPIGKQERSFITIFSELSSSTFTTTRLSDLPRLLRKGHSIQIDGINHDLKLIIEFDGEWTHGRENPEGKSYELKLSEDADTTETLLNAGYKIIRIREQHPTRSLGFVQVNPENLIDPSLANNLYQVEFKGNSFSLKNRDVIDDVVKEIIENRSEWFKK